MNHKEHQQEEREVLESIYDGDGSFKMVNETTLQYKITIEDSENSFLLEIVWGPEYPEVVPIFNMDTFYNKHITKGIRDHIVSGLQSVAEQNVGEAMTYTLLEWLKENAAELLNKHSDDASEDVIGLATETDEMSLDEKKESGSAITASSKAPKKVQLTKGQKRKLYGKLNAQGEMPRGWDWVDIVKHLSQSGGSIQQPQQQASAAS